MNPEPAIYLAIAGVVMVIAAFLLGRRTSSGVARQLELEAELTSAQREQSRAEAEAERLRNELDSARSEHDDYRLSVVDHFSGTSDLLRDLTVQYRSVYEHLTKGASTLCPEGFVGLTEGLPVPQLAEPQRDLELEAEDIETLSSDEDTEPVRSEPSDELGGIEDGDAASALSGVDSDADVLESPREATDEIGEQPLSH
jgi:hypothetical protein